MTPILRDGRRAADAGRLRRMLSTGRRCDGRGAFDYFRARACAGDRESSALPELACGWASQEVTFEAGNGWVMGLHGTEFSREQPFTRGELAALLNRILGREPESLFGFAGRDAAVFRQSRTRRHRIFWRCRRRQSTTRRKKPARTSAGRDLDRKSGKLHARKTVFRAFSRFYMLFRMDRARKMAYNTRA